MQAERTRNWMTKESNTQEIANTNSEEKGENSSNALSKIQVQMEEYIFR